MPFIPMHDRGDWKRPHQTCVDGDKRPQILTRTVIRSPKVVETDISLG